MRPLTEDETKIFFEKLAKYIGRNIKYLIDRQDEPYVFRLHKTRVYYIRESILKLASNIEKKKLVCLGTLFGKFTKGSQFRLHVTCLDFLAQFAQFKVWVKPSAEMSFLYGKHVLKAGLGRITENTPRNQPVVVFSMGDIPLGLNSIHRCFLTKKKGFGVTAHSTQEARKLEPTAIVCLNQADIGEYLRDEETLGAV